MCQKQPQSHNHKSKLGYFVPKVHDFFQLHILSIVADPRETCVSDHCSGLSCSTMWLLWWWYPLVWVSASREVGGPRFAAMKAGGEAFVTAVYSQQQCRGGQQHMAHRYPPEPAIQPWRGQRQLMAEGGSTESGTAQQTTDILPSAHPNIVPCGWGDG